MSTLKAARADNFYFPPDDDYRRQNKRKKHSHSASSRYGRTLDRVRNRGRESEGDGKESLWSTRRKGPIIRFEMPFKVICLKCNAYIAKGVRFDAEKRVVGKYFSTDILAFRMTCFSCFNRIVIQTDPEKTEYVCKEGVRRKIEVKDPKDPEVMTLNNDPGKKANALLILEQQAEETLNRINFKSKLDEPEESHTGSYKSHHEAKSKARAYDPELLDPEDEKRRIIDDRKQIESLEEISESRNKDFYLANSALRRRFRKEKKEVEKGRNENFALPLVPLSQEDVETAKKTTFVSESKKIKSHLKRLLRDRGGLFDTRSVKTTSAVSIPSTLEEKKNKLHLTKYLESKSRTRLI